MRYSAAEKLEIIRLVEQSHLPQRRSLASLASLGIPRQTFCRWYDRLRIDIIACSPSDLYAAIFTGR